MGERSIVEMQAHIDFRATKPTDTELSRYHVYQETAAPTRQSVDHETTQLPSQQGVVYAPGKVAV